MGLYFMLIAGGSAGTSAISGALSFSMGSPPWWAQWYVGSALFLLSIFICILYE